jgi:hypothetical protein
MAARKRKRNPAVLDMSTGALRCRACGDSYYVNLPCPLDLVLAMLRAWEKGHRHCRPRPELLWVGHAERFVAQLRRVIA